MGQWTECRHLWRNKKPLFSQIPTSWDGSMNQICCLRTNCDGLFSQIPTSWDGSMNDRLIKWFDQLMASLKSRPHEMGQWTERRIIIIVVNFSQIPTSWDGSMNFVHTQLSQVSGELSNPDLMRWVNELGRWLPLIVWIISQIPTSWDGSMNLNPSQALEFAKNSQIPTSWDGSMNSYSPFDHSPGS